MILRDDFTTWLLASGIPSIRYQAMTDLLGCSLDDPEVVQTRQSIMDTSPVQQILAGQSEQGSWQGERSYYTPKYFGTHWSLMLLSELGIDGQDARFQTGVEFMLKATAKELNHQFDSRIFNWSCFWGNLLRYALHAGRLEDPRVEKLCAYLSNDLQDKPCHCEINAGNACAWGAVRSLWGMAGIPEERRTPEINRSIEKGLTFLLDSFQLVEANYPTGRGEQGISPLWFRLNFPLFYQVDILFTLRVVEELGQLDHPGAQPALDWLEKHQGKDGRWKGTSPYRHRTWSGMGNPQETSRWVSLQASRILAHAGRLTASPTTSQTR